MKAENLAEVYGAGNQSIQISWQRATQKSSSATFGLILEYASWNPPADYASLLKSATSLLPQDQSVFAAQVQVDRVLKLNRNRLLKERAESMGSDFEPNEVHTVMKF